MEHLAGGVGERERDGELELACAVAGGDERGYGAGLRCGGKFGVAYDYGGTELNFRNYLPLVL